MFEDFDEKLKQEKRFIRSKRISNLSFVNQDPPFKPDETIIYKHTPSKSESCYKLEFSDKKVEKSKITNVSYLNIDTIDIKKPIKTHYDRIIEILDEKIFKLNSKMKFFQEKYENENLKNSQLSQNFLELEVRFI